MVARIYECGLEGSTFPSRSVAVEVAKTIYEWGQL